MATGNLEWMQFCTKKVVEKCSKQLRCHFRLHETSGVILMLERCLLKLAAISNEYYGKFDINTFNYDWRVSCITINTKLLIFRRKTFLSMLHRQHSHYPWTVVNLLSAQLVISLNYFLTSRCYIAYPPPPPPPPPGRSAMVLKNHCRPSPIADLPPDTISTVIGFIFIYSY